MFGTAAEMLAVSFDARSLVHRKFLALAAHRSAFGVTEEMLSSPPPGVREMLDAFRPVFEREVFVLGGTRIATPHWPLRDLFDGVQSGEPRQAEALVPPAQGRTSAISVFARD